MKLPTAIKLALALVLAIGLEKLLIDASAHDTAWWFVVPGFVAVFAFSACLGLAFFAKAVGKYWLQRHERYYQRSGGRHG
jgi:membrane protein YdbS with pleckstrin-like domain